MDGGANGKDRILVDIEGAADLLDVEASWIRENCKRLPRVPLGTRTVRYRPESLREVAELLEEWPDELVALRAARKMNGGGHV